MKLKTRLTPGVALSDTEMLELLEELSPPSISRHATITSIGAATNGGVVLFQQGGRNLEALISWSEVNFLHGTATTVSERRGFVVQTMTEEQAIGATVIEQAFVVDTGGGEDVVRFVAVAMAHNMVPLDIVVDAR